MRSHIGPRPRGMVLLITALSLAGGAQAINAQDMFPDVEYISGHAGMEEKEKGVLLIGESEVRFTSKDGKVLFAVPLAAVTEVGVQTDVRDASVGKKLLFGGLAGSRKEEFVQVSYETAEVAEGLVFKVKKGTSTGIVAKIKFAAKKATNGDAPTTNQSTSNSAVPVVAP